MRHCRLIRTEYWPALPPPKVSRRLLGKTHNVSNDGAAFRIESRFVAYSSKPWNAGMNTPTANCSVRRSLYPRIMRVRVCPFLTSDVKLHHWVRRFALGCGSLPNLNWLATSRMAASARSTSACLPTPCAPAFPPRRSGGMPDARDPRVLPARQC